MDGSSLTCCSGCLLPIVVVGKILTLSISLSLPPSLHVSAFFLSSFLCVHVLCFFVCWKFDPGFMEHKEFSEFYRFCFKFNREEASKKTLEKEVVIAVSS